MEKELENLQKTNTTLELQLTELKEKLQSKEVELESAQSQNKRSRGLLRRIRNDIHNASGLIQEPRKLGSAISVCFYIFNLTLILSILRILSTHNYSTKHSN